MYNGIDEESRPHLLKLIDFIYNEVGRAGGDGDALWYSRFYEIKDIKALVEEYNEKTRFPWEVKTDGDNTLHWGTNQEWVIITNNEEEYNLAPGWIQIKIRY